MATALKNLSDYNPETVPDASELSFGIVVAEWNHNITSALLKGAIDSLKKHGVNEKNIIVHYVPGTFELTYGAKLLAENTLVDAVITLGCVIQGETPHFDYVCMGVTQGITTLNIENSVPIVFGVLTTHDLLQAEERAGGRHGNKGDEAAITAIKMAVLNDKLQDDFDFEDYFDDEDDEFNED